jgi:hypothetical protein
MIKFIKDWLHVRELKKQIENAMRYSLTETVHHLIVEQQQQGLRTAMSLVGLRPDVAFLILHYDFILRHTRHMIKVLEGERNATVKAKFIVEQMGQYARYDKEPSLASAEHPPVAVLTTPDEIINFFEALRALYAGSAAKYYDITARMIHKAAGGDEWD